MQKQSDRHQQSSRSFYQPRKDSMSISNRSKSPTKTVNGIRIYNFSDIESYRKIHGPLLNEDKKKHIKQKLNIQKEASIRAKERNKHKQSMVQYNYNPFCPNAPHSKSEFRLDIDEDRPATRRDIVTGINNLKKKVLNRKDHSASLIKLRENAKQISSLFQKQAVAVSKSMKALSKPKSAVPATVAQQKQPLVPLLERELDLDEIVALPEEQYNSYKYKSINIFRLLFHKEQFFNKENKLDRLNFSWSSLIDKMSKYKIPFSKEFSRQARKLILKKPEGIVEVDGELEKNINFDDIIGVASGRFTPQFVLHKLHHEKIEFQEESSLDSEVSVKYNQKNRASNIANNNQSGAEVAQYLEHAFSKQELAYQKLCQNRKEQINFILQKEEGLLKSKIYHKQLHEGLRQQAEHSLSAFIDADFKYPKDSKGRDRTVAVNKETKKKNEVIKMNQLLQSYFLKKESGRKIADLIAKRK